MDFRRHVRDRLPALGVAREEDIVEELAQHLDEVYREGLASGLDAATALAQATAALPEAAGELAKALRAASRSPANRTADAWLAHLNEPPSPLGGAMLTGLRRDLRHALRTFAREPGFTAAVVITLALGMGGTTATYSAIDAILLQSAPVAEPDRVVNVYMLRAAGATANPAGADQVGGASYPDYADLRDSHVLDGLAAFSAVELTLDVARHTRADRRAGGDRQLLRRSRRPRGGGPHVHAGRRPNRLARARRRSGVRHMAAALRR